MKKINKNLINKILDFALIFILILLSIKKFGFYKTDSIFCEFCIICIFMINVIYKFITKNYENLKFVEKKKCKRVDIIQVLILLFSISYLIPIFTNNYLDLSSSIDYFIRYFVLFAIYSIVKESENKNMFVYLILIVTLIQCILAIDQIGNKIFNDILNVVNSGYIIDINLDRMSGTSQYANVFAINCAISAAIILYKLLTTNSINNLLNKYKKYIINIVLNLLFFIYTSSIILSNSRAVIILFLIAIIYIIYEYLKSSFKEKIDKKYLIVFFIIQILYITIYCTCISKLQKINQEYIYYCTFIFYLFVTLFSFLVYTLYNYLTKIYKEKIQLKIENKKIKIVIKIVAIILIISTFFVIFNLKKDIVIYSDANINSLSRNVYNLNKNTENSIKVKIKPNVEDTRYKVDIIAVDNTFNSSLIGNFNYYSRTDDTFDVKFIPDENFNYLIINVVCNKGNLNIEEILVNEKENYTDYLFLPSDVVYRLSETFKLNLSLKDRYFFYKDAIKIFTSSIKNIFFGIGGGGYEDASLIYRDNIYSSNQVHSSILQILVESGILGISIFVSILVILLKKSDNSIFKILLFMLLLHSFIDISFSYLYNLCLFAILLGLTYNDKFNLRIDENLFNIFKIIYVLTSFFVLALLLGQNVSYYYKIVKYDGELTIENAKNNISQYEKIVLLDSFENRYRENLNNAYISYLELIKSSNRLDDKKYFLENKEAVYIVKKIEENLFTMLNNEKYDIDTKIKVSDMIIKYLDYFCYLNYSENINEGYEIYLNLIYENVNYVDNLTYNDYADEISNDAINRYVSILKSYYVDNKFEVIKKYIEQFENIKICE